MDLVSVIVPVYNAEKTVEKCLESIRRQSYKNLEVLVVDDGSTDASEKMIKAIMEKDKRFRYYRQENFGVSRARNKGIALAAGKYIAFCDSDDWVDTDFIGLLVSGYSSPDVGLSIVNYVREDDSVGKMENSSHGAKGRRMNVKEVWRELAHSPEIGGVHVE